MKLYDYLPSQNAYKVRLLLRRLDLQVETSYVSIFEGESHTPEFLARNPAGTVPVLELEDGRCIAESNAILCFLAEGSPYLPDEPVERAQVMQWLFFEQEAVQPSIATLRHWTMTGKLARRHAEVVAQRRAQGESALEVLERHLDTRTYLAAGRFTIADIAVHAYTHLAREGGFDMSRRPAITRWCRRIASEFGPLPEVVPYAADAHSARELR